MKNLTISMMMFITVGVASAAFAETAVFTLTVTIPPHVVMSTESQVPSKDKTLAQVEQVVRNNQPVVVKSIVVL